MMKKVISVSLYGSQPFYLNHAVSFLERAKKIYPGWAIRYYIDRESAPREVVDSLRLDGAEIVFKTKKYGGTEGTFWRFLAADDPSVDLYIVRDVDTLIGKRDRQAVDEWLASGKSFHVIRDHWEHNTEILAGLWGGRKRIADMEAMVEKFLKKSCSSPTKLSDQIFMREKIYPKIFRNLHIHSSYVRYLFEHVRPSPPYDEEEPCIGSHRLDEAWRKEMEWRLSAYQQKSCARKQLDITQKHLPQYMQHYLRNRLRCFGIRIRGLGYCIAVLMRMIDYCCVHFCICRKVGRST